MFSSPDRHGFCVAFSLPFSLHCLFSRTVLYRLMSVFSVRVSNCFHFQAPADLRYPDPVISLKRLYLYQDKNIWDFVRGELPDRRFIIYYQIHMEIFIFLTLRPRQKLITDCIWSIWRIVIIIVAIFLISNPHVSVSAFIVLFLFIFNSSPAIAYSETFSPYDVLRMPSWLVGAVLQAASANLRCL